MDRKRGVSAENGSLLVRDGMTLYSSNNIPCCHDRANKWQHNVLHTNGNPTSGPVKSHEKFETIPHPVHELVSLEGRKLIRTQRGSSEELTAKSWTTENTMEWERARVRF
jgi:hypothetical protein